MIVVALQAVGIILVLAMLIVPAATARLLVHRFALSIGSILGIITAVVGLYLSYYLNIPSACHDPCCRWPVGRHFPSPHFLTRLTPVLV